MTWKSVIQSRITSTPFLYGPGSSGTSIDYPRILHGICTQCTYNDWLVVYQPLWKIWVSQLGLLFPIYGKIKCTLKYTIHWLSGLCHHASFFRDMRIPQKYDTNEPTQFVIPNIESSIFIHNYSWSHAEKIRNSDIYIILCMYIYIIYILCIYILCIYIYIMYIYIYIMYIYICIYIMYIYNYIYYVYI